MPRHAEILVVAAAVIVLTLAVYAPSRAFLRTAGESVIYFVAPTAERAYATGARHFDAMNSTEYDIKRAERYFEKALVLNPKLPYLQHQLARIAFLRGDFATALSRINLELEGNPNPSPSSYYVRGLIEGYIGKYTDAVKDYEVYVKSDPTNWAATNDLAWVLLKANRPKDALAAIDKILPLWPENPWLLNSKTTALFELGRLQEAREAATAASRAVMQITERDWLRAYPGNDPLIAAEGIQSFQSAVIQNMHSISVALEKSQKP